MVGTLAGEYWLGDIDMKHHVVTFILEMVRGNKIVHVRWISWSV